MPILLVCLVITSFVPTASAGSPIDDAVKAVGNGVKAVTDGAKNAIDYTHEVIKEVTEVNKRVITDPDMRSMHLQTAADAATGAIGGPVGVAAGYIIGTVKGYGEKIMEAT